MKLNRSTLAYVSAAALGAALLFSAPSSAADEAKKPAPAPPQEHVIKIIGMEFVPKVVHVAAGESVTWVNADLVPHGVKAKTEAKGWDSGLLQPKQSWTHTMTEGGAYFCPYHPTMEGSVVIDPPSS